MRVAILIIKFVYIFYRNFILNEDWKQLISKIAITCIDCNSRVMTVVGHSSPEGYLPEEVNGLHVHYFFSI